MASVGELMALAPGVLTVFQFETIKSGLTGVDQLTRDLTCQILDFYYLPTGQGMGLVFCPSEVSNTILSRAKDLGLKHFQCSPQSSRSVAQAYFYLHAPASRQSHLIIIEASDIPAFTQWMDKAITTQNAWILDLKTPRSLSTMKVQAVFAVTSHAVQTDLSQLAQKLGLKIDVAELQSEAIKNYLFSAT